LAECAQQSGIGVEETLVSSLVTTIATVWPELAEGDGYTVTWVGEDVLSIEKRHFERDRPVRAESLDVSGLRTTDVVEYLLSDIDPEGDHEERIQTAQVMGALAGGGLVYQLEYVGQVTPNFDMLNAEQVAVMLGVSAKTIHRQVRSGDIVDCRWLGNKLLFKYPDDVDAILEKAKPTHPEHPAYMTEEAKLLRATGPREA
jgi:hypothetical protein